MLLFNVYFLVGMLSRESLKMSYINQVLYFIKRGVDEWFALSLTNVCKTRKDETPYLSVSF